MSDLISKEELLKHQYRIDDSASLSTRDVVDVDDIEDCPSTDIMECARAIKEYCKSKPDNVFLACFKCPFFDGLEKNEETVCKLFGKPPHEWDLPEGEKGGAE